MEGAVPPDGTQGFSWCNSIVFSSRRRRPRLIITTRRTPVCNPRRRNLQEGEMQLTRLSLLAIPRAVVSLGAPVPAVAQSYPSGTIRIVAGGAAGPGDIIARIVANELGQTEGWQIVVENKPAALGTIAAGEVLKQPADGHTILTIALPHSAAPALLPNIGFRLDGDFVPVIKLMSAHHILVVNPT